MASIEKLVRVHLADKDGRLGKITLRPSSLTSMADMLDSVLSLLVPAIDAITDATPVQASTIYTEKLDYTLPMSGSLIRHSALVFWRNTDGDIATLIVPALAEFISYTDDTSYGVIEDLSVFDSISSALSSVEALDAQGFAINGVVIAAALFV